MSAAYRTSPDTLDEIRADLDHILGRIDAFEIAGDTSVDLETLHYIADKGREMYARRALEQAMEHAAAMLPAVGLPRLVGPGFKCLDPVEIGDALDAAIAALDGLDRDPDLEPDLGWTGAALGRADPGDALDREDDSEEAEDDGTGEPSLASPERHPSVPAITWGQAYTARGGEEGQLRWAEGGHHDKELADEDGPIDDDELDGAGEVDAEPSIGWPEDFTAEVATTLEAGADAEHDDADVEHDERHGTYVWVFGSIRQEAAHV